MLKSENIRLWLAAAWLLAFIIMWLSFQKTSLQPKQVVELLEQMEQHVVTENWPAAGAANTDLQHIWQKYRLLTLLLMVNMM